jgi:uncharacterized protein (DUF2147 family)
MDVKFKRVVWTLLLAAVFLGSPPIVLGGDAEGIVGVWNTAENDARIEIYRCGAEYCGNIAYLQDPNYPDDDKEGMAGLPLIDRNNPDPALRTRPLVGLRFMEGFRYLGHNTWDGGRIYNPENGKKYKATISLADNNRLMLRGYWGISLLGRTETWVRASGEQNSGA